MSYRFIDLFAGIGGTRIAFESEGMECVFSSEWDTAAQKTYEANFGHKPHGDITKIAADTIPSFDVLVAGFPCQPFSSIGLRQGFEHDTQGTLFFDVARILDAKRPSAFLLENVKGLKSHDKGRTWETIARTLSELGYTHFNQILDSSKFGVPQRRERIYIVGFKDSLGITDFAFPEEEALEANIGEYVESGVEDRSISIHLQKNYLFKKDDGRPEVIDSSTRGPVKTLVASYHKIQRLTGTFVSDGPTGLRLLSESECKAIMGFPKEFHIPVSRTQMFRQFGNSVTVPVVQKIAQRIREGLDAKTQ